MSQLPKSIRRVSTPGAAVGETASASFPMLYDCATAKVTVTVDGKVGGVRTFQSFVQKYLVVSNGGFSAIVTPSSAQDQWGDAGGSAWTVTGAGGSAPTSLRLTFTAVGTTAATSVTMEVEMLPAAAPPDFIPSIPSGPVQALRADLGVTVSTGRVSTWADQSPSAADESASMPGPIYTASDAAFNNHPTIGSQTVDVANALASGTLAIPQVSGWTLAGVIRYSGASGSQGTDAFNDIPNATFFQMKALGSGAYGFVGTSAEIDDTFVATGVAVAFIATVDAAGNATVYVSSTTAGASGNTGTVPLNVTLARTFGAAGYSHAEQVLWPRVLSGVEITQYMNYAAARYGITLH